MQMAKGFAFDLVRPPRLQRQFYSLNDEEQDQDEVEIFNDDTGP